MSSRASTMSSLFDLDQTLTRVLLLTFEGSNLANDVYYMRKVMEDNFGWGVIEHILPTSSSEDAQETFRQAYADLRRFVKPSRNKIIVYYGGHATMQDKNSKSEWNWISAPKDGEPVCVDHMVKVNPNKMFIDIMKWEIDALFIFHCPFNETEFPRRHGPPTPGNFQVLAMTEVASGMRLIGGTCTESTCDNDLCVACPIPPSTGRSPTRALIDFLATQLAAFREDGVNLESMVMKLTQSTGDIDMSKPGSNCLLMLLGSSADGQSDNASSAAASAVQKYVLDKPPIHIAVVGDARDFVLKKAHFAR